MGGDFRFIQDRQEPKSQYLVIYDKNLMRGALTCSHQYATRNDRFPADDHLSCTYTRTPETTIGEQTSGMEGGVTPETVICDVDINPVIT